MPDKIGSDAFEPAKIGFLGLFSKDCKFVDAFDFDETGGTKKLWEVIVQGNLEETKKKNALVFKVILQISNTERLQNNIILSGQDTS